jgi:hypothetical protein
LANERHRLRGVDLLVAAVEVGPGVTVAGVLVQAHSDRSDHLGELVKGHHGDLHEVVDRHASQELGNRVELFTPAGVAACCSTVA